MHRKFHNVLLGISVLPALLVLPARADVSSFDELLDAVVDGGNIKFLDNIYSESNVNIGTNTIIDGGGYNFSAKVYGTPQKTDSVSYYTSNYTMSGENGETGVFYRNVSNMAVGTVLYSDVDMTQEFGTVTFKGGLSSNYIYSVDSVGTQLALTRDSDSDSGRFLAFRDENDNLIYNVDDSQSLRRIINVPKRGIGATSVNKLQLAADERGVSLFEAILHPEWADIRGAACEKLSSFGNMILLFPSYLSKSSKLTKSILCLTTLSSLSYTS